MLLCLFFVARPALALETIDWEQLVPPLDELQNPYLRLSDDQQQSLYDLWLARETEAAGYGDEDLESLRDAAVAHLAEGGLDADQVLEELDNFVAAANANNSKLVGALNNKNVKIAGYVLPTEFSGDLVIEFLLVKPVQLPARQAHESWGLHWQGMARKTVAGALFRMKDSRTTRVSGFRGQGIHKPASRNLRAASFGFLRHTPEQHSLQDFLQVVFEYDWPGKDRFQDD